MYKASIENRGDTRSYATTRHAAFEMDTAGNSSSPMDTLLASLCGCLGHYVRDYLVGKQIPYGTFTIGASAELTPDKSRLDGIDVVIHVKDVLLTDQQYGELRQAVDNCKIHKILKNNPGVAITFG